MDKHKSAALETTLKEILALVGALDASIAEESAELRFEIMAGTLYYRIDIQLKHLTLRGPVRVSGSGWSLDEALKALQTKIASENIAAERRERRRK